MFSQYLEEFAVEEVSVAIFIERLTRRSQADFDVNYLDGNTEILCEFFIQTINDLKILQERSQRKCTQLEENLTNEKNGHRQQLETLEDRQHVRDYISVLKKVGVLIFFSVSFQGRN